MQAFVSIAIANLTALNGFLVTENLNYPKSDRSPDSAIEFIQIASTDPPRPPYPGGSR